MAEEPTHEELKERIKVLESGPAGHESAEEAVCDTNGRTSLLHPDWPEIKWNISGLFIRRRFLAFLVYMTKRLNISHALGSFHGAPDVIWNGGRVNQRVRFHDDAADYFKLLNDQGIGVLLTFSNLVLEEGHLSDEDSNRLLECLDETCGLNGVIVASDLLSDYVRKKRPGLKLVASVVKCFVENPEGNIDWYRQAQERFDRVVVHTDHMFDLDLLDKLDTSKAEILITEECSYKCPNRQRHQRLISRYNIERSEEALEEIRRMKKASCKGGSSVLSREKNPEGTRTCYLTHDEVKTIYDMGFRSFKISGRRQPVCGLAWNVINFVFNPDMAYAFSRAIHNRIDRDVRTDFAALLKKKDGLKPISVSSQ